MCHEVHPRAVSGAFRTWHAGDVADASDDFRAFVRGKVWRTVQVTSAPDYGWRKCARSFATELADHLWHRLQHLDESPDHGVLFDINWEETDPFLEMHKSFAASVFEPSLTGPFQAVFQHFAGCSNEIYDSIVNEVRHLCISIDAQVHMFKYLKRSARPLTPKKLNMFRTLMMT